MKKLKLLYILGLSLWAPFVNAVQIVNDTKESIKFINCINPKLVKFVMIDPFSLKPGESPKVDIRSCTALIPRKGESSFWAKLSINRNMDYYDFDNLKEDTVITFAELNEIIEVHRLDRVLPNLRPRY